MILSQYQESVFLASRSPKCTLEIGIALLASLYEKPLTIFLHGELGVGKTTFAKGLGLGLGLGEVVTSPTYALENRFGDTLLHIDLFRLESEEARKMLTASEDFPGVRVVEWSEKLGPGLGRRLRERSINVRIEEISATERQIEVAFNDISIPDRAIIKQWRSEIKLPEHIAKHCDVVGMFVRKCAEHLLKRGIVARPKALQCAGELHDLFRFVDFSEEEQKKQAAWMTLAKHYRDPSERWSHEAACARFLEERGYRALAEIVRPHGLRTIDNPEALRTIEQKLLFYADKRILFDRIVSLEERFEDFKGRYGKGVESEDAKRWKKKTQELEQALFGNAPLS